MQYNHDELEKKWQQRWDESHIFVADDKNNEAEKFYLLVEFPYPSGEGLHVGHPRPYTALDVLARKRRMQGYNVMFPMGWDAFGLPTENFAIKHKIHPKIVTENNIKRFKKQMKAIGFSFDWSREINTTDEKYYKWTQWIFIKMFKKGLAYKKEMAVNFCPSCKCVLANEEVVNGKCERCSSEVIRKVKSQWMLKITEYAERLLKDLDFVDYPERVKLQQKNWIGRSSGAEIIFKTNIEGENLKIYTTRPDTIFGVSYLVISPEHPFLKNDAVSEISNFEELKKYQKESSKKSDFERAELIKEKTGVNLNGITAINPINGGKIPIFVSDYVLMTYGTGAIMAVPGHDERDLEFAKKFSLPIKEVVSADGKIINSGFLDGLSIEEAKIKVIDFLNLHSCGNTKINYKLRDWVFSRQRYWGEPIPIIKCEKCGYVPVAEEDLPVVLPYVESYEPSDNGESPLSKISEWVNTTCPKCGCKAERETDTMPQWAGSSWYFLRYLDANNDTCLCDKNLIEKWCPVDWYNGGMEHTTLHLLYSRFWNKFLYDIGVVKNKEPYLKRTSNGVILGENGEKMSKSRGNVVNPDEVVSKYGADTFRVYEMFIGDFEKSAPWNTSSIKGSRKFIERFWGLLDILDKNEDGIRKVVEKSFNKTIKKVTNDIEEMKFNTAIAALMSLINEIYKTNTITNKELEIFTLLLCPFAPHVAEEVYHIIKGSASEFASLAKWPTYDESKCKDDVLEIAVQVNGKIKSRVELPLDIAEDQAIALALESLNGFDKTKILKSIYVKGKLINFVVKN